MNWFEILRTVLICVGAVGAFIFPVYYWITAPGWWRNRMGRFLMTGGMGLALLYLSPVISFVFHTDVSREIIRLVLILGAGFFAWYQVWLYRRVRAEELKRRGEVGGESAHHSGE